MNDPPEHEVAIFHAARRPAGGERAAYLDQACGGDAELRRRLDELPRVNEAEGDFLERPAQGDPSVPAMPAGTIPPSLPLSEKPGDRIGPYKLLQQIGEGGCGVVYMAEQEAPIRRRVALKVIKLGMDTKQVIARFEAERADGTRLTIAPESWPASRQSRRRGLSAWTTIFPGSAAKAWLVMVRSALRQPARR